MSVTKFFAVLAPGKLSLFQAFNLVKKTAERDTCFNKEAAYQLEQAERKIQNGGTIVLPAEMGSNEFDFARVVHKKLDWVSIAGAAISPGFCGMLAKELFQSGSLIMAAVLDRDYDYWQNADDPLQYRAAGRSCGHLQTRSNGLPPPLNQDIIDISHNPGRRFVEVGYFEIVAYRMWLTDSFWGLAGTNKVAVRNAAKMITMEDVPGLVEVRVGEQCFTCAEGEEGRMQDHVRHVLFGTKQTV